jgi:hypothetical protein
MNGSKGRISHVKNEKEAGGAVGEPIANGAERTLE